MGFKGRPSRAQFHQHARASNKAKRAGEYLRSDLCPPDVAASSHQVDALALKVAQYRPVTRSRPAPAQRFPAHTRARLHRGHQRQQVRCYYSRSAKEMAGQARGQGTKRERNRVKTVNLFHYIKVFSVCPQFVPSLFSVHIWRKPASLLAFLFLFSVSQCFCKSGGRVNRKNPCRAHEKRALRPLVWCWLALVAPSQGMDSVPATSRHPLGQLHHVARLAAVKVISPPLH